MMVFSGTFYSQTLPRVARLLASAADRGAQVRLCFGDPSCAAVAIRDREEGISSTLGPKIRSALTYYRPLLEMDRCEVRLHAVTLYASLFRYDDEIMMNPHVYGEPASANPVFHLARQDDAGIAANYIGAFERVWDGARCWDGGEL